MPPHKLRAVPARLAGFYFLLLGLPSFCVGGNYDASLKSLYDAHRWFELRDYVASNSAPWFYQGAVACAFNDLHRCEKKLGAVIKTRPQSDEAVEAHRLLESAYLRQGKYREALVEVDAVLALRPGDSDVGDDRPMLAALSEFPDQQLVRRRPTTLKLQDAGLPISINGVQATYWFDTGANVSALSEREAKRFGLKVLAAPLKVGGVTGAMTDSKVAVADEFSIGSVRLKHVAFLVLPDDQPPFNQSPPGEGGLIGIPVLLALQRFVWGADFKFEIGAKSGDKNVAHAELCFDGNHPVARIRFQDRSLAFTLDTGATNTDLYPPFAAAFPELIRAAVKTDSYKMEGVGGIKNLDAAVLSSAAFSIGGFPVVLKPAGVLLKPTLENSKFFHGNLGIDLLQQAHKTTFDFKAMTLTLQ
jgi:tetratricopeptide (TPR) repeat protein